MGGDWKEYIKNEKEKYKKIGYIKCPAFGDEKIYFNREGSNHFLRKGAVRRNKNEQKERIVLIPQAINILKSARRYISYREEVKILGDDRKASVAYFWPFDGYYENNKVMVIVRKINDGVKHFFSVIPKE